MFFGGVWGCTRGGTVHEVGLSSTDALGVFLLKRAHFLAHLHDNRCHNILSSLTGGQELVFKITQSCSYLASKNISINFYWVPSHLKIHGNEIADKLAKKGLFKRKIQSSYTSLSYIGRLAREKILE